MRPKSRGSVELQRKDSFSPPLIKLNYFDHEDDVEILAKGDSDLCDESRRVLSLSIVSSEAELALNTPAVPGAKFARDLLEAASFKAIGVKPKDTVLVDCADKESNTLEYWKCVVAINTASMGHPVGTCRMGSASREDTVVDQDLRLVFGTSPRPPEDLHSRVRITP